MSLAHADMEWAALVMWVIIGLIASAILLVAALIEFVSRQKSQANPDPERVGLSEWPKY